MNDRHRWIRPGALAAAVAVTVTLGSCKPGSPADPTGPGPQSPQTFSVTLEWTAPTTDAGGEPLDDLAGYRIHYRDASPADGAGSASVEVRSGTRATVDGLSEGTWYFGVSALDESGNESALSNEVSRAVGP